MSVIGPRPALWNQDVLVAERDKVGANDVKPGLTGWAQINGRDELSLSDKSTVLLEAMYYYLPIVSTNSEPGVQEVLQDKCGLVSAVGDAEGLADNIYKLYMDNDACQTLINAGKRRILDFSSDTVINQLLCFIKGI